MQEKKPPTTVQEAGRRGGRTTAQRYGPEHYERIGRMGGQRVKQLVERGRQDRTPNPGPEGE